MNILITGAKGFIGCHLLNHLSNDPNNIVIALDGDVPCTRGPSRIAREIWYDNICTRSNVYSTTQLISQNVITTLIALFKIDTVIHCAADAGIRTHITPKNNYINNNVIATAELLEGIRNTSVSKLIAFSSSSVYGGIPSDGLTMIETAPLPTPINAYAASKQSMEQLIRTFASGHHSTDIVIVRPFTVYGAFGRDDMLIERVRRSIIEGMSFPLYNMSHKRDFTYIDDVCTCIELLIRASVQPLEVVNIGTGINRSVTSTVKLIADALNHDISVHSEPSYSPEANTTRADLTKLNELIGWAPHTQMEQVINSIICAGGLDDPRVFF